MKIKLTENYGNKAAGSIDEFSEIEAHEIISAGKGHTLLESEEIEAMQRKIAAHEASDKKRKEDLSDRKINAAIARGAIGPKDTSIQTKWKERFTTAPTDAAFQDVAEWLDTIPGKEGLKDRVTNSQPTETGKDPAKPVQASDRIEVVHNDVQDSIKAYEEIITNSNKLYAADMKNAGGPAADKLRREAGRIFAADMGRILDKPEGDFPIHAANSIGTLSGTLVLQRTLQLLRRKLLFLSRISTDFSAEGAKIGQVITTRYRTVPTVVTYNNTTGWASSNAATTDVSVTIQQPVGVQVDFNTVELGSTSRNLLNEQTEGLQYALANAIIEAWVGVLTVANFDHTADIPDPSGPAVAWAAVGVNVGPASAFTRETLVDVKNGLDSFLNPDFQRLCVLNTAYYNSLLKDKELALYINVGSTNVMTTGVLPERYGFMLEMSQALNDTVAPVVGFAQTPSATIIAARLPQDYTQAIPGLPATAVISAVTEPETGLSLQMVQFVDHILARAYMRVAIAFGANKAQKNAGLLLTSS